MAQAKAHRLAVGSLAASCPEQSACDGAPGQNSQLWSTLDELDCRRNYHSALFTSIAISLLRSDFCGKGYRRSVSGSIYSTNTALAQFVQFVHETTPKGKENEGSPESVMHCLIDCLVHAWFFRHRWKIPFRLLQSAVTA